MDFGFKTRFSGFKSKIHSRMDFGFKSKIHSEIHSIMDLGFKITFCKPKELLEPVRKSKRKSKQGGSLRVEKSGPKTYGDAIPSPIIFFVCLPPLGRSKKELNFNPQRKPNNIFFITYSFQFFLDFMKTCSILPAVELPYSWASYITKRKQFLPAT